MLFIQYFTFWAADMIDQRVVCSFDKTGINWNNIVSLTPEMELISPLHLVVLLHDKTEKEK